MDNPALEVEGVIQALVNSPPSTQRQVIDTYFPNNAEFQHPFCRTGSFDGSRILIRGIYRWYKVMSPQIDLTVHSIAYDSKNLTLYVNISQVFRVWFVPFYKAPVNLTTVLKLKHDKFTNKYYIQSQEDLYQVNQFIKFVLPLGGNLLVGLFQFLSTLICSLLAMLFWPVSWFEQHDSGRFEANGTKTPISQQTHTQAFVGHEKESHGSLVTAPAVQER